MGDDVVITGLGLVTPIGCTEESFWDALCRGTLGASQVQGFDTTDLPRKIACQVLDSVDGGHTGGRASRLAVAAARKAVASAGIEAGEFGGASCDVTVGTTMGETEFIEERISAGDEEWLCPTHLERIAKGRPGSIARAVKDDLALTGPAMELYGACAAGNMALVQARRRLLDRRCDIALAGGADGFSFLAFTGFMRLRVMAAEVCRPFDVSRDGLLVGEGAAMFVLERESSARARNARIRARLLGGSFTSEDYHPTRPDPEGDGLTRAVRLALSDASLDSRDIGYVCAHGTGTPQNDAIEAKVLERCFPDGVAFSSIKALIGHTMGAAAAIETACCVLSLEQQTLVPTWNLSDVLPCSLDALRGDVRREQVRYAVNNAAGFGGYNSAVVIGVA